MVLMKRLSLVLALALPLLAGCGGTGGAADGHPTVVTSFYPLQYVAQRVAGRHADVAVYERGFQANVDEAVDQSSLDHVVDVTGPARVTGDDPHFWLDPTRLDAAATAVEKQLAQADPAHAAAYRRNLAALHRDLTGLDRDFKRGLASCRVHTIVVSHDAFGYLGSRYGLDLHPINGLSPDAEPSPAHLRELQDLIRKDGITTVFSEELASPKFADSLAGDLGIRAEVLDPIEGLSDETADQDYLSLMRANLATLRKANQCS